MHKNIKPLYDRSFVVKYSHIDNEGTVTEAAEFDKDLFADLIVRECILTIQLGITRDGPTTEKYRRSMQHISDIKEHFGIQDE